MSGDLEFFTFKGNLPSYLLRRVLNKMLLKFYTQKAYTHMHTIILLGPGSLGCLLVVCFLVGSFVIKNKLNFLIM